ncbi:RNA polymerase sigma-70 factor [Mycobacterium sp. OTB74]|uniref:RNA polymerase sigma-70 factor n=1 Tax=Mycobacterium sp. OTB74 TaxID=1853452 RepID=UPI0024750FD4|nr:RNA polymerase sigma-70 factor [Mycobacterium sp. OTB74]MDH6247750.1 RNA polymerase sigma-70 factor (TIGR02957 family) [Mycobacterium sp. OTB74]
MSHASVFSEYKPLLFTIAYEILGTVVDTEDVLQDSYLRWSEVDLNSINDPRVYLARIVARQALNRLRTTRRRRELYVGSWLPEPFVTASDVSSDATLAEAVSMAMMVVLESLGPDERAVFLLHTIFGFSNAEIAEFTGKSEAAVRQIAHRARTHVNSRRQKFNPTPEDADEIITRFLMSANTGDFQGLMDVLAPDVVQISDGGGKAAATRKPLVGREPVARFAMGVVRVTAPGLRAEFTRCNAMPTVVFRRAGTPTQALLFDIADGQIHAIYAVRNPDKLGNTSHHQNLTR